MRKCRWNRIDRRGCYSCKTRIQDKCKSDKLLAKLPGDILGDQAPWFDKLAVR